LLALHENDLMPRELALTKIWRDDNYFTSRSMDVYIAKLRKYLKRDDSVEILNIHGEGFRLVVKDGE
jgi:DNA-binding response OmpR family regulator